MRRQAGPRRRWRHGAPIALVSLMLMASGANPALADTVAPEPPADELPVAPAPLEPQMPAGDNTSPPPEYSGPAVHPLEPAPVNIPADLQNRPRPAEVDAARAARDAQPVAGVQPATQVSASANGGPTGAAGSDAAPTLRAPRFAMFLDMVRMLLFGPTGSASPPVSALPGHLPRPV
ncbi:hypothetical protein [Microbacterium sp. NPDC064584]|uniref:hypothetical protein n=1 Tax=Microbacterium sp. NPDC064584 TaxID=3155817 RepID=UPI00341BAC30